MPPYGMLFLLVIVSLGVAVLIYRKMNRSEKLDKFGRELIDEPEFGKKDAGELIKDAHDAKKELQHRVDENKEAKKVLDKEDEVIKSYQGTGEKEKGDQMQMK